MSAIMHKAGNVVLDVHPSSTIKLNADLSLGYGLRAGSCAETYLKLHKDAALTVNGYFKAFYGSSIEVFPGGTLTLEGGYINCGCTIACAHNIFIGKEVAIARGVYIYDSDHHKIYDEGGNQSNISAPVVIGNHVWIGVGAIILKGVTIGDNSIVAAGSVVTKNIPHGCIAAGNPARVVKEGAEWR